MSVFLDLVRFLASCAVVLSHAAQPEFSTVLPKRVLSLGPTSVGVFFVLSGYVICFSVAKSKPNLKEYFIARMARLYSVLVPGLILTYALLALGIALLPAAYAKYGFNHLSPRLMPGQIAQAVISCLLFLNESWWLRTGLPTNSPVWSLGYEAPYYLWFAIFTFAPNKWKWPLLALGVAILGLPILFLFPAWLLGAWLYRRSSQSSPSKTWAVIGLLTIPLILFATEKVNQRWMAISAHPAHPGSPLGILELFTDGRSGGFPLLYGGGLVMILAIAASQAFMEVIEPALLKSKKVIRGLASSTFSIYLFHLPVLSFLCALPFYKPSSRAETLVAYIGTVLICCFLARFTECKKNWWQSMVEKLWDRFAKLSSSKQVANVQSKLESENPEPQPGNE